MISGHASKPPAFPELEATFATRSVAVSRRRRRRWWWRRRRIGSAIVDNWIEIVVTVEVQAIVQLGGGWRLLFRSRIMSSCTSAAVVQYSI